MASSSVRSSVPDAALIEALARPPSLRTARELDRIKEMCNKHESEDSGSRMSVTGVDVRHADEHAMRNSLVTCCFLSHACG